MKMKLGREEKVTKETFCPHRPLVLLREKKETGAFLFVEEKGRLTGEFGLHLRLLSRPLDCLQNQEEKRMKVVITGYLYTGMSTEAAEEEEEEEEKHRREVRSGEIERRAFEERGSIVSSELEEVWIVIAVRTLMSRRLVILKEEEGERREEEAQEREDIGQVTTLRMYPRVRKRRTREATRGQSVSRL